MILKYNRYNIILIGLLCNSIIVISEESSLTDKPIVDNIISNDPVVHDIPMDSTKKSIKILKKSKALKRKKKKLRKTALRKSLKSNKNKKVINKSKESPPLSKGAKICLGAIGVGGVGLLASRKSSLERSQQSSSKLDQPIKLLSLNDLQKLQDLDKNFKKDNPNETILNEDELIIITENFHKKSIENKISCISFFYLSYRFYYNTLFTISFSNTSCNISLHHYLISLLEQEERKQLLNKLRNKKYLFSFMDQYYINKIYGLLELWDIIIEYSYIKDTDEKKRQQELFWILGSNQAEKINLKQEEIDQIIKHIIDKNKYDDLLKIICIFNTQYSVTLDENTEKKKLFKHLLSNLAPDKKLPLSLQITKLTNEELYMYHMDLTMKSEIIELLNKS